MEIVDADVSAAFAAYYAEDGRQTDREVGYNPESWFGFGESASRHDTFGSVDVV